MVQICLGCHRAIHGDEKQAAEVGWLIPRGVDPALVPWLPDEGRWTLPDRDGGVTEVTSRRVKRLRLAV